MPQMTGEQLAEEIKAISQKTPIILITGHLIEDSRLNLFDEILIKPFSTGELLGVGLHDASKAPLRGLQIKKRSGSGLSAQPPIEV